jgi:hypothetical protein
VAPDFYDRIKKADPTFAACEFYPKMRWMSKVVDDLYDPSYTDMLRVAFTSEFRRGKLQDLVALLSGRNFETKNFEEAIAEDSFKRLGQGVLNFINETNFQNLVMILRSAGFVDSSLIGSQNAVNFAYILYLRGKAEGLAKSEVERIVRRWFVMSVLTGRYAGAPETAFDLDIRQVDARGLSAYVSAVVEAELSEGFWSTLLPQQMETSSSTSPYWLTFQAAQVKLKEAGFLSRDITAQELIAYKCDAHHVYPRNMLKRQGVPRGRYNQIANYVLTQSEINIAISDKPPEKYFAELAAQCEGGKKKYGGITDLDAMRENLRVSCIPERFLAGDIPDYDTFLEERRKLMAAKIRRYFAKL